jgi:hypothetical protein
MSDAVKASAAGQRERDRSGTLRSISGPLPISTPTPR